MASRSRSLSPAARSMVKSDQGSDNSDWMVTPNYELERAVRKILTEELMVNVITFYLRANNANLLSFSSAWCVLVPSPQELLSTSACALT